MNENNPLIFGVTLEAIKVWLKESEDKNRFWLAKQCEVDKRTLDNWLSGARSIPLSKRAKIWELMDYKGKSAFVESKWERELRAPSSMHTLALKVTDEEFFSYNNAAIKSDLELMDWIIQALNKVAQSDAVCAESSSFLSEECDLDGGKDDRLWKMV